MHAARPPGGDTHGGAASRPLQELYKGGEAPRRRDSHSGRRLKESSSITSRPHPQSGQRASRGAKGQMHAFGAYFREKTQIGPNKVRNQTKTTKFNENDQKLRAIQKNFVQIKKTSCKSKNVVQIKKLRTNQKNFVQLICSWE